MSNRQVGVAFIKLCIVGSNYDKYGALIKTNNYEENNYYSANPFISYLMR